MMQQLSFDGRTRLEVMVDLAIKRLQHYAQFDERGYYLAFSGGKDSQCIYHLTRFGREPDEVGKVGEGHPFSLWCMGPISDEESKRLGKGIQSVPTRAGVWGVE